MRKRSWRGIATSMGVLWLAAAIAAPAQSYSVLYTFSGGVDGGAPVASLVPDAAGNLYGTTSGGGIGLVLGPGVAFRVDPSGTETVLHTFTTGGLDGDIPLAGLIPDPLGDLYGTTWSGGIYNDGVVFKLDSTGNETVLHTFTGGSDGNGPTASLIRDAAGNLYGTTGGGGTYGDGVVFRLDPGGNETVLYAFTGGSDGNGPSAGVVRDAAGNLYGTTVEGGTYGNGVVYELDSAGNETVLHSFNFVDGKFPNAGVVRDASGNLYGTTVYGGRTNSSCSTGCGVVFKLDPAGNETVLHTFTGGNDGSQPVAGLVRDSVGNLYGSTGYGGAYGWGVIFRISPAGAESVLHNFTGGADGAYPAASLLPHKGYLYGTTYFGGLASGCGGLGCGVVFKLSLH